ncbi:hypothetical protein [Confluentibacter sediminis]|uniref:hypothetical protein n=1 Tax=Confluentibacter sediminis TaxID=2219045 RepID=UPI000DAE2E0B|nr:hypothetical protein [Confluentibacter sediminis]
MKTIAHKFLVTAFFLIALSLSHKALANASQPGIWNAGGTVFTMLYPEDSLSFKKVQMQQERIYIQLYKGFAVVKGTYIFKNTSSENLQFKMGYPVNGIYSGGETDLNQITLDSLSHFKIKANQRYLNLIKENHPELNHNDGNVTPFSDNWMVWQMAFAPNEAQTVEVYFLVNTNDAQVRKGYNLENRNAFIYLLESGSVWHQPIEKGYFYVQLREGLTLENLQGLSGGFDFKFNEKHQLFAGNKINFSPTPADNLVAAYYEKIENFDFTKHTAQSEKLFNTIDELSHISLDDLTYTEVELGNPYEVKSTIGGAFPGLLTLFIIIAPFLIIVVLAAILIWAFVKWWKIKNKKGH